MAAQTQRRKAPAPDTKPIHPPHLPARLYTRAEAAYLLQTGVGSIDGYIRRGQVRTLQVGQYRCIPRTELLKLPGVTLPDPEPLPRRRRLSMKTEQPVRRPKPGQHTTTFRQLFDEQQGHCAICATQARELVIDHDHATGLVRGLLCNSCNTALGQFRDNCDTLLTAIEYLIANKLAERGIPYVAMSRSRLNDPAEQRSERRSLRKLRRALNQMRFEETAS